MTPESRIKVLRAVLTATGEAKVPPVKVKEPSRSHFLGLPVELRLWIYDLMRNSGLRRSTCRLNNESVIHAEGFPIRDFTALSVTCKLVHEEVKNYVKNEAYKSVFMIRVNAANAHEYPRLQNNMSTCISKLPKVTSACLCPNGPHTMQSE